MNLYFINVYYFWMRTNIHLLFGNPCKFSMYKHESAWLHISYFRSLYNQVYFGR